MTTDLPGPGDTVCARLRRYLVERTVAGAAVKVHEKPAAKTKKPHGPKSGPAQTPPPDQ